MSVAKTIELSAESKEGFDEAIREGLARAQKTIDNVHQARIKDQVILLRDGKADCYRVDMTITFDLK